MVCVCLSTAIPSAAAPDFGSPEITLCGEAAPKPSSSACGFTLIASGVGPQIAVMGQEKSGVVASPQSVVVSLRRGEFVDIAVPIKGASGAVTVTGEVVALSGQGGEIAMALGEKTETRKLTRPGSIRFKVAGESAGKAVMLRLHTRAGRDDVAVRWRNLRIKTNDGEAAVAIHVKPTPYGTGPLPVLPTLRAPIEQSLIEWDWRMQDGIGTTREPRTYAAATKLTLQHGDALIRHLVDEGVDLGRMSAAWGELRDARQRLASEKAVSEARWEDLWLRVHRLRRRIALANSVVEVGPLAFIKQVPGCFSHQLTQYYGRYARPGGGVFVLDEPGQSMRARQLAPNELPLGSYQHLDVSTAGDRILFAYCHAETTPKDTIQGHHGRYYHLYEMNADGSRLRRLTHGEFNDFSPRYLPNGKIVFISTRRRGWHRCGSPGCENYTLAIAEADGSNPRTVSFHETQEWDPAVMNDGRIIYTRWDYVDRHAVYYEQLWAVRPDGTMPMAFYGNNTFNPVGIWEPRAIPGTDRVIATAAAHHAMTAGSIILVDPSDGVDGPKPIVRLTPDALFPESEVKIAPRSWYAPAGITEPPVVPPEAKRWPGHCYRSPYPLSEQVFLAAYSFDALIGEPAANPANMFGLYLVDAFGNKELLYRDLNIASLWPMPIRPRPRPPVITSTAQDTAEETGRFFVQDVRVSDPSLPGTAVKGLRIVQVLPKSTPGANRPRVGIPNASPGKQVLGTVPVEPDGSAYFVAPAGVPLSFQALDETGQAVQVMRSLTYLQPGETASCVGCHESRTEAPPKGPVALAIQRPPSTIEPGPDGSRPLSYPILVQPVLDRHCVRCHNKAKPEGKVILTGEPKGAFTASYNALAPRVAYSTWGGRPGDFRKVNSEPLSEPGFFGAKGSALMALLDGSHHDVKLGADEMERLITWMDANALFYGTFDPVDQARQRAGERIAGPALE